MKKEKDLEFYLGLNYDVVLKKKANEYCLFIPDLAIIASGKKLDEAYAKLDQEKERYFKNIIEYNLQDTVNEPASVSIRKKQYSVLSMYLLKMLILLAVFLIMFFIVLLPVMSSIEKYVIQKASTMPKKSVSWVIGKVDAKLDAMSEKEQEDVKLKIRNMANKIKPFTDEIKVIFEDNKKEEKPVARKITSRGSSTMGKKEN